MAEFIARLTKRLAETFGPSRGGKAFASLVTSALVSLAVMAV